MQGDHTKNVQSDDKPGIDRTDKGTYAPGQSGNPAGKKKGALSILTQLRKKLNERFDNTGDNEDTFLDVILHNFVANCASGNEKYVRELLDRIEGKSIQRIEAKVEREPNIVDLSYLDDAELTKLESILDKVNTVTEGVEDDQGE